jgi:hypothetical protein
MPMIGVGVSLARKPSMPWSTPLLSLWFADQALEGSTSSHQIAGEMPSRVVRLTEAAASLQPIA